jgi:hypothetical protein
MTISGNAVISAVMLAIFSAMLIMAAGYSVEARFMPMIVGFAGAILSLVQLWRSLVSNRCVSRTETDRPGWRLEVRLLGWFAGFLLAIVAFGFLIAAPVMVVGFLVVDQRERPILAGALAAGSLAVLYLVFEILLELSLYRGLVAQFF